MAKFEFKQRTRKCILEFPDFTLELTPAIGMADKMKKLNEEYSDAIKNSGEDPQSFINCITENIDNICGPGVMDKIIGDREVDMYDYIAVCGYVTSTISDYCRAATAEMSRFQPPNK